VHSEKNSQELAKYESTGMITVYYWAHAVLARDWYRYAEIDPLLKNKTTTFEFDFLIYARAWTGTREYRLKFLEMLIENNLYKNSCVNFNPVDTDVCYRAYEFTNNNLSIKSNNIEKHFNASIADSNSSADYNSSDYQRCEFEIVLETLFDDQRLHLTEKSLRPIACGVPFILAATPGSLEYLRSYGFQTFGQHINEEYDQIKDPVARLSAIISTMQEISSMAPDKKRQLFEKLQPICKFNQERFFSDDFFHTVINEYKLNLNLGLQQLTMQHDLIKRELPFKKQFFYNREKFK
jgi:hypothetical protein